MSMTNRNSKRKVVPSSKPANTNASLDLEINEDEREADVSKDNTLPLHKVFCRVIISNLIVVHFVKHKKHRKSNFSDDSIEGQYSYDEGFEEKGKYPFYEGEINIYRRLM